MAAALQVFAIPELLEEILSYLPIHEIFRCQSVSRKFNSLINTSPLLRQICWITAQSTPSDDTLAAFKLNPYFARFNIKIESRDYKTNDWYRYNNAILCGPDTNFEVGLFDLKRVLEPLTLGSWTRMSAFQPPAQYLMIECYGDYSADENMYYSVATPNEGDFLRMGDVMAILAECQNRQSRGVDRWCGVRHYDGVFLPMQVRVDPPSRDWVEPLEIMRSMKGKHEGADIWVTVAQAWGSGEYPAFSLRRLEHTALDGVIDGHHKEKNWIYEMVVHDMEWENHLYKWNYASDGRMYELDAVDKEGEYRAKMLRVKEYEWGYLEACRDVYELLDA